MAKTKKLSPNLRPADTPRFRYRIRFAKAGLLRWISHRDLARLWDRLARRVALPLSMTEGFHPKPRIAFPSALALGVESFDEVVEIELCEQVSVDQLLALLNSDNQPGLTIHSIALLPEGFGKAQLASCDYVISMVESADTAKLQTSIDDLRSQSQISFQRKQKTVTADVVNQIPKLEICDDGLHLTLAATDGASLRPGDVMDLLGIGDWIAQGASIKRVSVVLAKEFTTDDRALLATVSEGECDSQSVALPGTLPSS